MVIRSNRLDPAELIQRLKEKSDSIRSSGEGIDNKFLEAGLVILKNPLQTVPECEEVANLPAIKEIVNAHYQGGYNIFHADISWIFPKDKQDTTYGSDRWHFDNVTPNMLKMMVYLTDVHEDTGAMRVVNRKYSRYARLRGFRRARPGQENKH